MNLITAAAKEGHKLTTAQTNLLLKLEKMGVSIDMNETGVATNPHTGYSHDVGALVATLVAWVHDTYSTYGFSGTMNWNGTKVAIGTFDRVRMLILSLNKSAYRDFID